MDYSNILKILLVCAAIIVGFASRIWLPSNNPVEKVAEEIVKVETGQDINLDIDSTEKK